MKHAMVDCETLATTADAVIMSIGAVRFDAHGDAIDDEAFYASISIDSNLRLGRRVSESTVQWWTRQSPAAQLVFHEPKHTLQDALESFSDWLGDNKHYLWSKGADFDLPMLALAYTQLDLTVPWEYWNSRCVRTLLKLPHASNVQAPKNALLHNALADAHAQAVHVQLVNKYLDRLVPMKQAA